MIMIGLAIIAFVFIVALIIGAIYWILWILTAIFVIVAIGKGTWYLYVGYAHANIAEGGI